MVLGCWYLIFEKIPKNTKGMTLKKGFGTGYIEEWRTIEFGKIDSKHLLLLFFFNVDYRSSLPRELSSSLNVMFWTSLRGFVWRQRIRCRVLLLFRIKLSEYSCSDWPSLNQSRTFASTRSGDCVLISSTFVVQILLNFALSHLISRCTWTISRAMKLVIIPLRIPGKRQVVYLSRHLRQMLCIDVRLAPI